jgi:hypothetical protein
MPDILKIFWRGITKADFFNIERARGVGPLTGGGQTYVSVSFSGLTYEELGSFLDVVPPGEIGTSRPSKTIDVGVIEEPLIRAPIEFASRYRPPRPNDRYKISRQNRQRSGQLRHPAWTGARGFPEAPNDVSDRNDARIPDLTYLKVIILRLDTGDYLAGFINSPVRSPSLPGDASLDVLFQPFNEHQSAGVIELPAGVLSLDALGSALLPDGELEEAASPEVRDAIEQTRLAAGRRRRGQGRRIDPRQRAAIEDRAMQIARERLEGDGWTVVDVSANRPYDFECSRRTELVHVEVKGTTGDGSSVLLTPGEVRHARERDPTGTSLAIVSEIELRIDQAGEPIASGGSLELILPWDLDTLGELRPTGFEYHRH